VKGELVALVGDDLAGGGHRVSGHGSSGRRVVAAPVGRRVRRVRARSNSESDYRD